MPAGWFNPETSDPLTVVPEVVYTPIVPAPVSPLLKLETNKLPPTVARPTGLFSPEISDAFIVVPEVVYSPTVPLRKFVSKICAALAELAQNAANAIKPETTNRIFIRVLAKLRPIPEYLGCSQAVNSREQRIAARISAFIVISRFGIDERDYCRSKLATGKAQ
jgi:hypothetical protein